MDNEGYPLAKKILMTIVGRRLPLTNAQVKQLGVLFDLSLRRGQIRDGGYPNEDIRIGRRRARYLHSSLIQFGQKYNPFLSEIPSSQYLFPESPAIA